MKAMIAMSGGVDSSVAAALVKKIGYECIGATMRLFDTADTEDTETSGKTCCSLNDVEDARSVARLLGMPYYVFNLKEDFRLQVMDKFVRCYRCGQTPNPCIDCNKYLKFGALYRRARELNCDYIATGHYARINFNKATGRYELLRAKDLSRDQSYVLYFLSQYQLEHTLFPLGDYTKDECRKMASEMGFPNASKHDSQDICFIPDGDHMHFIENYTQEKSRPGYFVDEAGGILGRHKGIAAYTIGQRKGLGLALGHPVYVREIRPLTNEIVLSEESLLYSDTLYARDFNWVSLPPEAFIQNKPERLVRNESENHGTTATNDKIALEPSDMSVSKELKRDTPGKPGSAKSLIPEISEITAKIRYRHTPAPAQVFIEDPGDPSKVKVVFKKPERAITKGQAVVLYDGDRVIGGGTIM